MKSNFENWGDKVKRKIGEISPLVMGIDPVFDHVPTEYETKKKDGLWLRDYVLSLLEACQDEVSFVKFQSAYFEAYGSDGVKVLADSIKLAKKLGYGVMLDAKRGDIESTAEAYAQAYLTPSSAGGNSDLEVDCMTVNPFLGPETLEPFVERSIKFGKGLFILAKTSNPGSGWLQDQKIQDRTVSQRIAEIINGWAQKALGESGISAIGAVVGVTYPTEGESLRALMPDSIFLAPGLGSQGGKAGDLASLERKGGSGVVISASRGITKVDERSISKAVYIDTVVNRIRAFQKELKA